MTNNDKLSFILTHLVIFSMAGLVNAAEKTETSNQIIKWKDEKGFTHYGDKLPVQESGRDNAILNQQGVILKQNKSKSGQATENSADSAEYLEQKRQDKALLSSFTTAKEIDAARDRSLEMDTAILHGLEVRKSNAILRLNEQSKDIDDYKRKRKPVPDVVFREIKATKAEISRIDTDILDRQKQMDQTRKRFEDDKQRFILLKKIEQQ